MQNYPIKKCNKHEMQQQSSVDSVCVKFTSKYIHHLGNVIHGSVYKLTLMTQLLQKETEQKPRINFVQKQPFQNLSHFQTGKFSKTRRKTIIITTPTELKSFTHF